MNEHADRDALSETHILPAPMVRDARRDDAERVWQIVKPVIRAGRTLALPADWSRDRLLEYWFSPLHRVRVAILGGRIAGTYYLKPNQLGGGDHVANCGYVTAGEFAGRRVATAMCLDSLELARAAGFRAMQFNFVIKSNIRAVELWSRLGFQVIGTVPAAFRDPEQGLVDALVMWRSLAQEQSEL